MKAWKLAAAAASCWAVAHAQEPPGAALPGTVQECGERQAALDARGARLARSLDEVDQEGARLARETGELQGERRRAEAAGPAQVEAYNARRADLNARFAAHNERVAAVNAEVTRFNAESAQCSRSLRLKGGEEPRLDADERAVLAAALADGLGRDPGPVMLEDHTATFLCSRSLPDVMQFDGCSGMRRRDESAQDIVAKLKRAWPDASDAALADLAAKGDMRARIDEPLALPVQQVLRGYGEGAPSTRVDASIKVSRVGFDPQRREAIAFVATRSKGRASRRYVRLERTGAGWAVTGRVPLQ